MLFNSLEFLVFFPTITILYFFLPKQNRVHLLIIAGAIFYMALIPKYLLILICVILVDYLAARIIDATKDRKIKKLTLLISIIANLSFLIFFKYLNFLSTNLQEVLRLLGLSLTLPYLSFALPVGLSFHVFQSLSYTIEVYKKRYRAEKNLAIYALYVMFYPQLVAGPIERPQNLLPQLKNHHSFNPQEVANGLKLMLWGMFKKVVIADRLALLVNQVYTNPQDYSGFSLILATYFFSIQILCDFSGYSDIAIGAAQVMGIKLMTNFNRPYFSQSIAEFWNRWHISLSSWFRDYVYIPLGGNRVNKINWYKNILIVFLLSGLWHGADWKFVIWGALHGSFIIITQATQKIRNKISNLLRVNSFFLWFLSVSTTFILVTFAWIFFRASSVSYALLIISIIFKHTFNLNFSKSFVTPTELGLIFSLVSFLGIIHFSQRDNMRQMFINEPLIYRFFVYYFLIMSIIFLGKFGGQQFIYFQF